MSKGSRQVLPLDIQQHQVMLRRAQDRVNVPVFVPMPAPNGGCVINSIWRTGLKDCFRASEAPGGEEQAIPVVGATALPLGTAATGVPGLPRGVASVLAMQPVAAGLLTRPLPKGNLARNGELPLGPCAPTVGTASTEAAMDLTRTGEPPLDASRGVTAGRSLKGEAPLEVSVAVTAGLGRNGEPPATVVAAADDISKEDTGLDRSGEVALCPALGVPAAQAALAAAATLGGTAQERAPSTSRSMRSLSFFSRSVICLVWSATQACRANLCWLSRSQRSWRAACWSRLSLKTGTQRETPGWMPSGSLPRSRAVVSGRASSTRHSREAYRSSMSASRALANEAAASLLLRTCSTSWVNCCSPSWVTVLNASTCSRSMSPWYADAAWSCSSSARVQAAHWPSSASRVRFSKSNSALTSSMAAICTLISCP
mmetsp:Transcript_33159/g.91663  ORF Transcript_33159/g.91663 Transcript_33159/m.91663 type:complete len:428 (-) Transcript_33159:748-2031(-)